MKIEGVEDIYELSPVQQGMLFHTLLAPGSGVYFEQVGFPLEGSLDASAFERAWQTVLDRHTVLRSSFHYDNLEKPLQVVRRGVKLPINYLDWSAVDGEASQHALERFLAEDRARGFDLANAPLMRLTVIELAPERRYIVFSLHHLLLDGWSSSLVYKEAAAIYDALCRGLHLELPTPRPFADYIEWLQSQDLSKAELYWRSRLAGYQGQSPLGRRGTSADGYHEHEFDVGECQTVVERGVLDALRQVARRSRITLNTVIQGAWALVLNAYLGQEDVVFGATVSGRPAELEHVESMVGLFINTLPVRVNVQPDTQLITWLQELHRQESESRQFDYTPLADIQGWCGRLSRGPLFETLLAFENFPAAAAAPQPDGAQGTRAFGKTNYPLNIAIVPTEDLWLKVMYSRSRFDRETIDRLLNHFVHVLTAIAENPDRRLIELPLLTEIEVGLLAQWNRSETAYPRDSTIPELFEEQAQKTPEAVAVSVEGEVLTYGALRDRAARLTRLLRERVVSETIVGICVDRADDLVTAMLGILKAGGAYLPMDATHPEEHLAFMLENAQAKALVTSRLFAPRLKALGLPVIELESLDECDYPTSDLPPRLTAESLAYVMYTSGSTGRPKGIAVPHRAVIRLVRNTDYVALGPEDRVAQASNPSFDASTFEIWGALLNGARLVSIRKEVLLSPEELTEAFARDRITTLFITTDLFNQLAVESPWIFRPLRVLLYGGSAVNPRRVREILEQGRPERLVHCYGPTESTTFASWHEVGEVTEKTQTVPIGRPIANTWLYVLDDFGRFSPIGVAGELYIGGDGVARGYINKPDLTAEKFVPDPFSGRAGARMYRTGDRVLRRADGTIEFVGRLDSQVKIRGFRVELGEIEAVLQSLPGVANAVVLLREDATGAKRLLAFVVTANSDVSVTDLRRLLERKLPDFMMPSTIVLRETLPLTPNGKVDRAALALAGNEAAVAERAFVEPRTPAERSLAEIWRNVLDLKRVGIHDNFFELGGDSIVSIQVIARAREAGLYLTLRQLFQNQTVAQLAAVVGSEPGPRSDQGLLSGNVPLLPIQRWFFEQEPVDAHRFNMASLVETPAGLDSSLLARVTRHLMTHHDALRLRFTQKGGRWQQFCEASVDPTPFAVVDLRTVSEQDATGRIEQGAADAQASLNLESGPILRIVWFDRGELPGRILFVIHHLVMDNVSWRILLEDFWHAYESLARGEDVQLPPKTSSLGHWANRLQEYAQSAAIRNELAFWIDAGSAAGHTPLDMEGGENLADLAESVTVELDEDNTQALVKETPRAYQTQINDVLLTALAQTLARWTGEDTVKFDLEGHGRELLFDDIDLTRTVGWFTSIFPVRLRVPSGHAGDTLISVKEQLRQIPHHGVTYGVLRYLTGDDEVARLFTNSVPDVAFNYQGQFGAIKELESTGASRSPRARRAHLIEINAAIVGGRLRAHWEFSKRHHHFATIEAVASEFKNRLLELISHTCSRQDTSFTPSDFGEAGISQRDLDKLLGAIKRTERPAV